MVRKLVRDTLCEYGHDEGDGAAQPQSQSQVQTNAKPLRMSMTKAVCDAAADEACEYLLHSFGDATRIDYGTGHECNFVCFLMVLEHIGLFGFGNIFTT